MITFKSLVMHKSNMLKRSMFICPGCLDECYAFYDHCTCGSNIDKATNVIKHGVYGRFIYYSEGWPAMDELAKERLAELRKKKLHKRAGFI